MLNKYYWSVLKEKMSNAYLYHVSVLVEGTENLELEYGLEESIADYLSNKKAELISSSSEELTGNNYGRCSKCGTWVSDASEQQSITAFSNGKRVKNCWYCDLCLPRNHPNSF